MIPEVPFSMKCSIHVFANDRFVHTSCSPPRLGSLLPVCVRYTHL